MRRLAATLVITLAATAQVAVLSIPKIDAIEFFGLHRVPITLARQALGLSPGAALPESKGNAEDRLLDIDEVVNASIEAVCCDGGKNIVYVGIEERGAEHYELRPAPGGAILLSDDILMAYQAYAQAQHAAELAGNTGDLYSLTYPLAKDAATRAAQQRFPELMRANLALVREVLRDSGDDYHREIAAYVLPFAPNPADLVDDLRFALSDASPSVRANAARGLVNLSQMGGADPASHIRVPVLPFLALLESITWSDRMQAALALEALTRDRDVVILSNIRGSALDALSEMARWQVEQHAYPAFQVVGRVAHLSDAEIRDAWQRFGRETVIGQALDATR